MLKSILIPVNEKFIEVFEIFMNPDQKNKIRANYVRQYIEGIVDLLLKDKILNYLKESELYEGINQKRKIEYVEKYSPNLATTIRKIFTIGGEGSHFKGQVSDAELREIIEMATHFVEDIFVEYFLSPEHKFGTENIFTIFSMLPLKYRIYILENVFDRDKNFDVIDRLSLAYFKNNENEKLDLFLKKAVDMKVINKNDYDCFVIKYQLLKENLTNIQTRNADCDPSFSQAKLVESIPNMLVVGFPSSENVFDTSKAVDTFKHWFEEDRDKYPEFINLFYCLMARDDRRYV